MPPLKNFFRFAHVPTARKIALLILAILFWLFFFWMSPGDSPPPEPPVPAKTQSPQATK